MNKIERLHKREIKKAEERILRDLKYLIQAYTQIELFEFNQKKKYLKLTKRKNETKTNSN